MDIWLSPTWINITAPISVHLYYYIKQLEHKCSYGRCGRCVHNLISLLIDNYILLLTNIHLLALVWTVERSFKMMSLLAAVLQNRAGRQCCLCIVGVLIFWSVKGTSDMQVNWKRISLRVLLSFFLSSFLRSFPSPNFMHFHGDFFLFLHNTGIL